MHYLPLFLPSTSSPIQALSTLLSTGMQLCWGSLRVQTVWDNGQAVCRALCVK